MCNYFAVMAVDGAVHIVGHVPTPVTSGPSQTTPGKTATGTCVVFAVRAMPHDNSGECSLQLKRVQSTNGDPVLPWSLCGMADLHLKRDTIAFLGGHVNSTPDAFGRMQDGSPVSLASALTVTIGERYDVAKRV